ncbi:MAG: hypothetical protein DRH26_18865 [Deltaproteobacteria bacterium]|nr:MAG: hypothetical protein DRH26_18865 [Deltaproteobacteria bacterium]
MNSIPERSSTGLSQDRGNLQNTQFSGHARRQIVNVHESLDAGLTIKTREGDIVTLSSSRFAQFNASEYNSKGEIQTDSGNALLTQHTREITLATGDQFSFFVQGDLNEQELADIEAIVKGVDSIAAEVAEGDMEEAVAQAMAMGNYSSVSMYSADISYQRSYSMIEETRSVANSPLPVSGSEERISRRPEHSRRPNHMNRFAEKMARFLEKQEEKLLAKAQQPLTALFDQLQKNIADTGKATIGKANTDEANTDKKGTSARGILKAAGEQVDQLINNILKNVFETTLNNFV